jgi:predicted PurR-regulated permease PerM
LIWVLGQVVQVLSPVLWPLAVAGVLAYLLDPVVDFLERRGVSRSRAIVGVFIAALALVAGLMGAVVPQLVVESRQLAARIPAYTERLEQRWSGWINHPPPLLQRLLERESSAERTPVRAGSTHGTGLASSTNLGGIAGGAPTNAAPVGLGGSIGQEELQAAAGWLAKAVRRAAPWLWGQAGRVASWFGVLAGLALVPVYTFYFLLEKRSISSRWTNYLPMGDSRFKEELIFVLSSINNYLIAFFRGQVLVAICDGVLYTIGFLAIGLPYAALIGAAAVVLTLVPYLGAIVTCSVAVVIALVQFGDWLHPVLVLGVFSLVQALEGTVISPRILGGRVGLPPVSIIIALMVGTTLLAGLLGGILAIPLTAALRVLMFPYVWKRPVGGRTNPQTGTAGPPA